MHGLTSAIKNGLLQERTLVHPCAISRRRPLDQYHITSPTIASIQHTNRFVHGSRTGVHNTLDNGAVFFDHRNNHNTFSSQDMWRQQSTHLLSSHNYGNMQEPVCNNHPIRWNTLQHESLPINCKSLHVRKIVLQSVCQEL